MALVIFVFTNLTKKIIIQILIATFVKNFKELILVDNRHFVANKSILKALQDYVVFIYYLIFS